MYLVRSICARNISIQRNVWFSASVAAISADLPALKAYQSLLLCKAAKISAASSVIAKTISYLLLYLVVKGRFVARVLICSQRLINTVGVSNYITAYFRYIPPLIWGKSGHIQTALYGKMGRVRSPHPYGLRKYLTMPDGATATFDLFEPQSEHCIGGQSTAAGCV